jgi:hypothetical protein
MKVTIKSLATVIVMAAISIGISDSARADDATQRLLNSRSVQEAFDRAYFRHDKNFYRNSDWDRQATLLFNFWPPELEIAWDAEWVNAVYQDALSKQATSDPFIRTRDLQNPYCQSLLGTTQLCGAVPANPIPPAAEPIPPLPPAVAPVPAAPVPALY